MVLQLMCFGGEGENGIVVAFDKVVLSFHESPNFIKFPLAIQGLAIIHCSMLDYKSPSECCELKYKPSTRSRAQTKRIDEKYPNHELPQSWILKLFS